MVITKPCEGEEVLRFDCLTPRQQKLLVRARYAILSAYNPYSGFGVGAAVVTRTGAIRTGANVENAAYGSGVCAERSVLVRANAENLGDKCVAMAVVASKQGKITKDITAPCGECRQVISEFAERSGIGKEFEIILATTDFEKIEITTIGELLPGSFGPEDLVQ